MKTYIRHLVVVFIIFASTHAGCLDAQTFIDTNYYRYVSTPFIHEYKAYARQFDEDGSSHVIDTVTLCKDNVGFSYVRSVRMIGSFERLYYTQLLLPHGDMDIYGIAVFLDSIRDFHRGNYLKMYVCEKSEDGSHFVKLDSVVLDENTMGVRRYMIHPVTRVLYSGGCAYDPETHAFYQYEYDSVNNVCYPIPYEDDCTLYNQPVQVLELYFDNPVHIRDSELFWNARWNASDETFYWSDRRDYFAGYHGTVVYHYVDYEGRCRFNGQVASWDQMMAITEPLPQWEQDRMELLITNVIGDPDPQDPDPDNPGGDEGIGEAVGSQQSAVRIYPNPASNSTVVTCDAEIQELTLRDINGRLIRTLRNCGTATTLDTSALTPGLYPLQVTTPSGTTTRKLAIK